MKPRLTAAQAQDMARANDPSAAVETILNAVREAAEKGEYAITSRAFGFGDGSYYTSEDAWPAFGRAIIRELTALGYQCQIRCHEGQFVDMWLEVSWKEV